MDRSSTDTEVQRLVSQLTRSREESSDRERATVPALEPTASVSPTFWGSRSSHSSCEATIPPSLSLTLTTSMRFSAFLESPPFLRSPTTA